MHAARIPDNRPVNPHEFLRIEFQLQLEDGQIQTVIFCGRGRIRQLVLCEQMRHTVEFNKLHSLAQA